MKRATSLVLMALALPFLTGFDQSRPKIEAVQGIWKTDTPIMNGTFRFLEVGKDYIIFGDDREDGLILEEREEVVLVRKAGLPQYFARFVLRDENHIIFEISGGKFSCIRSSEEERRAMSSPPVKHFTGPSRSQGGIPGFDLSKGGLTQNSLVPGGSFFGEDQKNPAVRGEHMQFSRPPGEEKPANRRRSFPPVRTIMPDNAPRRTSQTSSTDILDANPAMRTLAHRYGDYMRKVALQLQEARNQVLSRHPPIHSIREKARIDFTIAPDGSVAKFVSHHPHDGSSEMLRSLAETILHEAAPFDPPTQQMLDDPLFDTLTLTVTMY